MYTKDQIKKILTLSGDFSDAELLQLSYEKQNFYHTLSQNAPNEYLKKLYQKNETEIADIITQLSYHKEQTEDVIVPLEETNQNNSIQDNTEAPAMLVIHTENQESKSFELQLGKTMIGRSKQIDEIGIVLENDPFISRIHAGIILTNTVCEIGDSESFGYSPSKNGVYINGYPKKLVKLYELADGDTIQLGNTKLVFKWIKNKTKEDILEDVKNTEFISTVIINII